MRLLLDTHVFIWWDGEPEKLTQAMIFAMQDPANTLGLSTASIWEMQIKAQLGKLTLRRPLREIVESQQTTNGLEMLPVTAEHVYALDSLPAHHKDPFDRLLIAQANAEGMVLVTADMIFSSYPVRLL